MVWMCKTGAASAIVTEDSDVFLYCIATGIDTHVLFKLDDQGFVQVPRFAFEESDCAHVSNAFASHSFMAALLDTFASKSSQTQRGIKCVPLLLSFTLSASTTAN